MNSLFQRLELVTALVTVLVMLTIPAASTFVHAERQIAPPAPATEDTLTSGLLHNAGFDNNDWYYFHERYDSSYPDGPGGSGKPILPDDDNNNPDQIPAAQLQDWRLWYMRGTPLIQTFAESDIVQSGESVAIRTHDGDIHQGGLYQVIYDTTPCRLYTFQMYGRSQPDPGENPYSSLRVGIDKAGWHPDSANDPAVPGAFPSTTVWGDAHDYKRTFGSLSVTAEADADHIVVYTYADARGGRRHAIIWDTGSFADVTPDMIHDPNDLPSPGEVNVTSVVTTSTTAQVKWTTTNAAIGQVYYRLVPSGGTPPAYPNKIYLPLVSRSGASDWQATTLDETAATSHTANITGLQSGSEYEYIVVSRGLSGGQCKTWVSGTESFTTAP